MENFMRTPYLMIASMVAIIASAGMASAAGQSNGSAEASGPSEPATHLKPYLPPLHLSGAQQQQIRAAVAGQDTEVTFQLKGTKPHKDFAPKLGEKVPPALHAHALPSALTQKLPQIADYKYMKVKGQVLIVNPMTHKIVSLFPEQQG
jgi:hypothetical protein